MDYGWDFKIKHGTHVTALKKETHKNLSGILILRATFSLLKLQNISVIKKQGSHTVNEREF